jgi:hypothetical protein
MLLGRTANMRQRNLINKAAIFFEKVRFILEARTWTT